MAAVCGTIRLLLFLNFLTFVLYLKSTKTVKHQANGHDSLVVLSLKHWSISVRRFNRLKLKYHWLNGLSTVLLSYNFMKPQTFYDFVAKKLFYKAGMFTHNLVLQLVRMIVLALRKEQVVLHTL